MADLAALGAELAQRQRIEPGIGATIPAEGVPEEVLFTARGPVRERLMLVPDMSELAERSDEGTSRKRSFGLWAWRGLVGAVMFGLVSWFQFNTSGWVLAVGLLATIVLVPLAAIVLEVVWMFLVDAFSSEQTAFDQFRRIATRVYERSGHVCVWCGSDLDDDAAQGRCASCGHAFDARSTRRYWGFSDEGQWVGPLRVGLLTDAPIAGEPSSAARRSVASDEDSAQPADPPRPLAPESTPRTP